MPSEIFSLTQMTNLQLVSNSISGTMPSEIGSLTQMTYLSLAATRSAARCRRTALTQMHLYLYGNSISGTMPSEIGSLTQLADLSPSNSISGTMPSEIPPYEDDQAVPQQQLDRRHDAVGLHHHADDPGPDTTRAAAPTEINLAPSYLRATIICPVPSPPTSCANHGITCSRHRRRRRREPPRRRRRLRRRSTPRTASAGTASICDGTATGTTLHLYDRRLAATTIFQYTQLAVSSTAVRSPADPYRDASRGSPARIRAISGTVPTETASRGAMGNSSAASTLTHRLRRPCGPTTQSITRRPSPPPYEPGSRPSERLRG